MREYKFRGRRIDTGELVYGYLIGNDVIVGEIVEWDSEYFCTEFWYKVDSKTVGQYTGLKDRNGQEIYEGDIVTGKRESHWHGGYDKVYAEIKFSDSTLGFMVDGLGGGPLHDIQDIEVIGNIYEYPELLAGRA